MVVRSSSSCRNAAQIHTSEYLLTQNSSGTILALDNSLRVAPGSNPGQARIFALFEFLWDQVLVSERSTQELPDLSFLHNLYTGRARAPARDQHRLNML